MSKFTEIVDSLESRIGLLLRKYKNLEQETRSLEGELDRIRKENQYLQEALDTSGKEIKTLKAANALLGSNDYKKETKLQINGLIREIDQCIVQLSE